MSALHARCRRTLVPAWLAVCALALPGPGAAARAAGGGPPHDVYRPDLAVPELLAPFLKDLEPGHDAFPAERDAAEIAAVLRGFGAALRARPADAERLTRGLLAPEFRGGTRVQVEPTPADATFSVRRARERGEVRALDARGFASELAALASGLRDVTVAEFLVDGIAPAAAGGVSTRVRAEVSGSGGAAARVGHVARWEMTWRRDPAGWRVTAWTIGSLVTSRATQPLFTEITGTVLGSTGSFQRQLGTGLDAWMASIDGVLTRDSNGHHGVAVGDVDGDGLDDIHVAQPAGLPNRLYRNRGDGTFEDITDRAGVGILDDTAMALIVDVDNDGDQDLVLSTGTQPLLLLNDGTGRFTHVPDAFRFEQPLQGSLTSIAMADYDRDGFLDLYLCVYSYFYGAGEDKAGTPMPYYDARNGPPGVLFRNDGTGRFVEVTRQAGLDEGNDRYHFAAAWADYDGDGWIDLLVVNDFGTNNLYRNRGDGTFEDVAAKAGVLDHAAGMSAAFVDVDNDGLLDIYTGNMWTDAGLRVTAAPTFMPDAPEDVRAHYHRHARGNSLFRNRGDGTFDDVTLSAGADMGRWAWSADGLDFDSDGWEDLYVVNGMLTREGATAETDLEGFFWRQVVARSPATVVRGTPYDDAWRAINQLLIHGSIASRQRNVFLRNDGQGRFDDVSAVVGLDLDQDGRSFAVLDIDRDGDPDLVIMAARQAPQLRVFRNDVPRRGAALALQLTGTTSNRDAIGARVVVETERLRRTKVVHAGSGFLSQGSKELLVGLGPSERVVRLTVHWPSGGSQVFTDLGVDRRYRLTEGGDLLSEAFERPPDGPVAPVETTAVQAPAEAWMYEPFPAPDFSLPDLRGEVRSLSALQGRPAVVLLWSSGVDAARDALEAIERGGDALRQAGVGALAMALDEPSGQGAPARAASGAGGVPIVVATREVALGYAILHRHLFMNRHDVRLPTLLLLDGAGRVVKVYRGPFDVSRVVADAAAIDAADDDRLARALPFPGRFHAPLPLRNYLPYGRTLLDQGLDAAAVVAFERASQANPSPPTLYRLGTLLLRTGETSRARLAFERALALDPDLAEASNDLGTLLAEEGDLAAAITRFRAAVAAAPEYPDALNNLGYALLLTGREQEARGFYEQALRLQPDFPEALNNLGLLYGRSGDLDRAERYFREALARRSDYGEAANNVALVLVARGRTADAVRLLEELLEASPQYEPAYLTLAKIHLSADRTREGLAALERLLQRNPRHPIALELLREYSAR